MELAILMCLILALMPVVSCADDVVSAKAVVVHANGEPVPGVKVFAVHRPWHRYDSKRIPSIKATEVSGEDGSVVFPSIQVADSGEYHLIAFTPDKCLGWVAGEGTLRTWFYWDPEPEIYRIVVAKPGVYEGRVVDEEGSGLPGVMVEPGSMAIGGNSINLIVLRAVVDLEAAVTDDDGNYRLVGVPEAASVSANVSKSGYASRLFVKDDPIVMKPGGSVSGRVRNEQGEPIKAEISLESEGHVDYGRREISTESVGSFAIEGLSPDSYMMIVEAEDHVICFSKVEIAAGKNTTVPDVILQQAVWISGRVMDKETRKPVEGAQIAVVGPDLDNPAWHSYAKPTKANGIFRVRALPGNALIGLTNKPEERQAVTIPDSGYKYVPIEVEDAGIRVARGKVVGQDGKPVHRAIVTIHVDNRNPNFNPVVLTDADGQFESKVTDPLDPSG